MARFDPDTYPDRLTFEANARRIRSDELGRVFGAAGAWVRRHGQDIARHLDRIGATASAHTHRPSAS
jgi:hypothetical protein